MVERLGRAVVCVEGDERAFKVTTAADLDRAVQLARHDDGDPGDEAGGGHDHAAPGEA
jgi:2-C-methyl-D-erythritol 4-phosphate cytidylyltransferase